MSQGQGDNKDVVWLDSWGFTTTENVDILRERTKKWKPELVKMACHVNEMMRKYSSNENTDLRAVWYINDGTLLGAFRNGGMIDHDYDFDYGLSFLHEDGTMANLEESKTAMVKVAEYLTNSLDKQYTVKHRTDYACKIEVYDESSGNSNPKQPDWYNVHIDMQICYSPDKTKFRYAYFRENYGDYIDIDAASVFPLTEILFESVSFPCPKDAKTVLTAIYCYIGSPAKYNKETRKYEPL